MGGPNGCATRLLPLVGRRTFFSSDKWDETVVDAIQENKMRYNKINSIIIGHGSYQVKNKLITQQLTQNELDGINR